MFGDVTLADTALSVAGLDRINVITGDNGSGRTRLLKSIYDQANNNDGLRRFGEPYNLGLSHFGEGYADSADDVTLKDLSRLWLEPNLQDSDESMCLSGRKLLMCFIGATYQNIVDADYDHAEEMVYFHISGINEPVHLKDMGSSFLHCLRVIYAVGSTENGVVVIDDMNLGLTINTFIPLWAVISNIAENNTNQVFVVVTNETAVEALSKLQPIKTITLS